MLYFARVGFAVRRQQRSKKTAEVEKKLRDALGMEDEGEHDSEEKAGRENTQREIV